jgi:hypothetical protein
MGVQDRDWYWEGREGTRRAGKYSPLVFVLAALGVMAVAWIISLAVVQWRAEAAAESFMRSAQEAQRKALQAQHEAQALQARRQAQIQQQEAARLQAIAERRRGEDEARRAAAAAVDRKARAWDKYYSPPPGCSDAATVECANSYIRAKRAFEERYARGAL